MVAIHLAPLYQRLIVAPSAQEDADLITDIESRLMHLGFIEGAIVEVKKKSFLKGGPILVEVRGRLVALSQDEAQLVWVKVAT